MKTIHSKTIRPLPSFAPQPMPDGETSDNYFLGMDPDGTVTFRAIRQLCGPSSLSENFPLIGRQHNFLVGPVGQWGMRTGLVAYVPPGWWNLQGNLVIAGPSNVEYVIAVWQGHGLSPDPARPGIVSENPQIVGGGVHTWTGAAHLPFTIPFCAHLMQYMGEPGTANEIMVSVYPKVDGSAGSALGLISADATGNGNLPANFASSFMITRMRGA